MSYLRAAYIPATEDEARAKFAYFRKAEATIDSGPAPYEPAPIRKNRSKAVCGTHPGYKNHILAKEKPCDACREARAIYQREYRARNKAAA